MKTKDETIQILWMGQTIELPKPNKVKELASRRPYHDGMAYYQQCMDEEWERWEKDSLLEGERKK
jgi:hypothetical protein